MLVDILLGIAGRPPGRMDLPIEITGVNMVNNVNLTSIIVALLGSILVIAIYRFIKQGHQVV